MDTYNVTNSVLLYLGTEIVNAQSFIYVVPWHSHSSPLSIYFGHLSAIGCCRELYLYPRNWFVQKPQNLEIWPLYWNGAKGAYELATTHFKVEHLKNSSASNLSVLKNVIWYLKFSRTLCSYTFDFLASLNLITASDSIRSNRNCLQQVQTLLADAFREFYIIGNINWLLGFRRWRCIARFNYMFFLQGVSIVSGEV